MPKKKSCAIGLTCTAPVNIAVVKYWGKRDEMLVLPLNSSISVTLSQNQLHTKTTITASESFSEDRLWLNGREETFNTPRIQNLLNAVKSGAVAQRKQASKKDSAKCLTNWKLHVCSENNFPTAAGLASSAAGYACLAYTLAQLYDVKGDISIIARQGSGSACRSIPGGFVVWDKGEESDGSDSVARQIAPHTHWPDLRILILVVSDQKKHIGSSEGMQATVKTSQLMATRVQEVPDRINQITQAILNKDFQKFAEHTMKDSNQLHAVCLDTYPPISYMTDVSRQIIAIVHALNKYSGSIKVAYTFDAGPNACLYMLQEDVAMVIALMKYFFPPLEDSGDFVKGLSVNSGTLHKDFLSSISFPILPDAVKYMIHTQPGPGPQTMYGEADSLLNNEGLPKCLSPPALLSATASPTNKVKKTKTRKLPSRPTQSHKRNKSGSSNQVQVSVKKRKTLNEKSC